MAAEMMIDQELNELKKEFLDEARAKVDEMEGRLGASVDEKPLERIAYLAHQLKGSGGSYGYQRISDTAAEIERIIESSGGNGERLREQLASLRNEIDTASKALE